MPNRDNINDNTRVDAPAKGQLYPFSVPEGYFEALKENVLHRIAQEPQVVARTPLFKRASTYLYLAASLVGLLFLLHTITDMQVGDGTEQYYSLDEASPEHFERFLLEETAEDYWGEAFVEEQERGPLAGI